MEDDPRFIHIKSDPRFRRMPKSESKFKIDKRFNALFTSDKFKVRTDIDKRGRPAIDASKRNKHVMERFYELSEESDSVSDEDTESSDEGVDEAMDVVSDKNGNGRKRKVKQGHSSDFSDEEPTSKPSMHKKLRTENTETSETKVNNRQSRLTNGIKQGQDLNLKASREESDNNASSEESDGSEEETDSSSDGNTSEDEELLEYTKEFELDDTEVEHKWNELHTDAPMVSESTHRLAVCNMDWDFVKAQDLFVLFKSFAGEGRSVKSVAIYTSEYGKERMSEEARLGPKEMRTGEASEAGGADWDDAKKTKKKKKRPVDSQQMKRLEKQKSHAEREKLREYQLNRLRYYYAVVDCDSVEAADAIYSECDGMEYQLSAVKLDLRFIPDDMTFDDKPKEMFTESQTLLDYQPALFNSTALSQGKVDVTWDETEFDRLSKRVKGLQPKELETLVEDNQYADLIAPPESDSEAEDSRPSWLKSVLDDDDEDREIAEEEKIQLYRKVLMEKMEEEEAEQQKEDDVDKEIEWQTGLKSSVEKKFQSKDKEQGSVVSDYLRKKKEKKKKKKQLKKKEQKEAEAKNGEKVEEAFSDDDLPADLDDDIKSLMASEGVVEPSAAKKKKKKKNTKSQGDGDVDEMDEKERAELELLMMDDPEEKNLAKPEPASGKKLSRRQKRKQALLAKQEKESMKEDFDLDLNDPRFGALYSSHHFHIDPNAPQFKQTKNMKLLVNEQIKRKKKKKWAKTESTADAAGELEQDSKSVSKQLLESLKKKMKR